MKNFKTALKIGIVGCVAVLAIGCKTPGSTALNLQVSEKQDIASDVYMLDSATINEALQRSVNKLKNGIYNIVINHVEYDTDKPVDEKTGKPPEKSNTQTTISAQEEQTQSEDTTVNRAGTSSSELHDRSKVYTKVEVSEKSNTKQGLADWQVTFICLGIVSVLAFIIWLMKKFNVWKRLF